MPDQTLYYIREYISEHASPKILSRGEYIFHAGKWNIEKLDIEHEKVWFRVESTEGVGAYRVKISDILTEKIYTECNCPYDYGDVCKHSVAALMALEKVLLKIQEEEKKINTDIQPLAATPADNTASALSHTTFKRNKISNLINFANTSSQIVNKAQSLLRNQQVKLLKAQDNEIIVEILDDIAYQVRFRNIANNMIESHCTCKDLSYKLCKHKVAALLELRMQNGEFAFDLISDHTERKRELLAEYGFGLNDDFNDKFQFQFEEGKLTLKTLDPSLKKISTPRDWQQVSNLLQKSNLAEAEWLWFNRETTAKDNEYQIGYAFVFERNVLAFRCLAIVGKLNTTGRRFIGTLQEISEAPPDHIPVLNETELSINRLLKLLNYSHLSSLATQVLGKKVSYLESLNEQEMLGLQNYILVHLQQLFELLQDCTVGSLPNMSSSWINTHFKPLSVSTFPLSVHFQVSRSSPFIEVLPVLSADNTVLYEAQQKSHLIFQSDDTLYLPQNIETAEIIRYFQKQQTIKIREDQFGEMCSDLLQPLMEKFEISFDDSFVIKEINTDSFNQLYIRENNDSLILQPVVRYGDAEFRLFDQQRRLNLDDEDGTLLITARNTEAELELRQFYQNLHPSFEEQNFGVFYISFHEALRNGWLFQMFELLHQRNIEILGYQSLKKFRYNTNSPRVNATASSGIDWFDIRVDISFGEQSITLKQVQKAIANRQNYVVLDDGTFGLLPEEWIRQNENLLKLGEIKGNHIKLSKFHFSLIDEMYISIDSEELMQELENKKRKLLQFDRIEPRPLPAGVQATLRDYQMQAFNWLGFLEEFGWGGCIADDMGLGKTLQALTLLQEQARKQPDIPNLVVLPTTLVFNWENEIRKFCPSLTYFIHTGAQRLKTTEHFSKYNIIITTYGIVVNDIEILAEFPFNYVILDESQAVKNPNAKRCKAVQLLKAKNRLAMTGTPIENNTFDLYSQINFVNPGLLGPVQFFKEEFATPIDRDGDEQKVEQLRRLIKPFMLRRTKEQVASELPPKTETILFCEMEAAQKRVYEQFRQKYRDIILDKIDTDGMAKSSFTILEGLLKLRQICDSPYLLNNEEQEYGKESIKVDELMTLLLENVGNHKALVFSQFLDMLALVRHRLEENGIGYEYMDGSTQQREKVVQRFKQDEECRVFLASLKAGGVGLNLTEADYVFLLDPWWNPAVEMQAIDRTHRIGQTKNVFAYKFICKDSIEEKILQLQERKKHLAAELITSENGFVKNLTREDIEELFS